MKFVKHLLLLVAFCLVSSLAVAHSPLCDCFDNGDGTITCEGGFSDGSSASGVGMTVKDGAGAVLQEGKMDANSEFSFPKPEGDYSVTFDAGEGHQVVIKGENIVQ
ncbi:hypothetical protein [Desulfocurvus sp.]|jgi:hypothetical protein|uniref:hypothetical protein n=1 Tax=Desulfocurvus sp. TaxID=2871698 RepID=UPI0025BEA769|nr:hypothetical protein [Desulfocurvus sp.]MCK9241353.1 hypothetical protein [Desulfocurvus sp.]